MTINELQNQIKEAMRNHDKNKLSALRQVLQAVRQIEVDEQREINDEDITAATKKLIKITKEEADALSQDPDNHSKRINMLNEQVDTLNSILPQQITGDELMNIIDTAIADNNATTMRDMGRVMAAVKAATKNNSDMSEVSRIVKSKLS